MNGMISESLASGVCSVLEHNSDCRQEEALRYLVTGFIPDAWLADNPELRRTFAIWLRAVVLRRSRHTLVLPEVSDLKELKMTLAERFDTWADRVLDAPTLRDVLRYPQAPDAVSSAPA